MTYPCLLSHNKNKLMLVECVLPSMYCCGPYQLEPMWHKTRSLSHTVPAFSHAATHVALHSSMSFVTSVRNK